MDPEPKNNSRKGKQGTNHSYLIIMNEKKSKQNPRAL